MLIGVNKMLKLVIDGVNIPFEVLTFSGGEEHVKINMGEINLVGEPDLIEIQAYLKSSSEVMQMFNLIDAVNRIHKDSTVEILMPYFPYARQDRACEMGEAHGAQMFSKLIKAYDHVISRITVVDPHSDVVGALFDGDIIEIVKQEDQLKEYLQFDDELAETLEQDDIVIVSPDGGALKKILGVANELNNPPVVAAEKVRNTRTGAIERTVVHDTENVLVDSTVFIVDDICDGGRTFHELAKVLKEEHGVDKVILYVTHGIFSKGRKFSDYIDTVCSAYPWDEVDSFEDL